MVYFVTVFVEGLMDEIRRGILIERPQDMDAACSLALLQEEALEGVKPTAYKKSEHTTYIKSGNRVGGPIQSATREAGLYSAYFLCQLRQPRCPGLRPGI